MKVAVSFIKSLYDEKKTIELIDSTSADYIHVDIMDGEFVSTKNYDFSDIKAFMEGINKLLDVHLMVRHPLDYIKDYASLNTKQIIFHAEADEDIYETINKIHSYGIKAGLAINPDTPVEQIEKYLDLVDTVLVMSVYPGKGGQKFIPESSDKIKELNNYSDFLIEVDGGVNKDTIDLTIGADMVVSGSYVCESQDYEKAIESLRN
ncbi:MAG: ribulose-phosphate 3-epimerase [bacterium]|nr:ribulose-phosphate 3-epimerase [bacterium]